MVDYVRVPGTNFVRDINSMGLTNKDSEGLEEYKTRRNLLITQKEEINSIKSEITNVKTDMDEIKQLLHKLLEKG